VRAAGGASAAARWLVFATGAASAPRVGRTASAPRSWQRAPAFVPRALGGARGARAARGAQAPAAASALRFWPRAPRPGGERARWFRTPTPHELDA